MSRLATMVVASVLLACNAASADDWAQPRPRIFASSAGVHALKVLPTSFQEANGELFALNEKGAEATIWARKLVNVPMRVWVANRGRNVATVDTYGNLGYAHALVVYDAKGEAVCDYPLEKLLTKEEIAKHVIQTAGSRWWAEEAKMRFLVDGRSGGHFVIQLRWGKTIQADLKSGKLQMTYASDPARPGERARKLPRGRYTGSSMAMVLDKATGATRYDDTPPAICHLDTTRSNRILVDFPDPVLGRGKTRTMTLPLSTTAPRNTWVLNDGAYVYKATSIPYSTHSLMMELEVLREGKRVGGARQFFGVELE